MQEILGIFGVHLGKWKWERGEEKLKITNINYKFEKLIDALRTLIQKIFKIFLYVKIKKEVDFFGTFLYFS